MLIDVHAHFFPERSLRSDWRAYNASRLQAGERVGITVHVTSTLGTFGRSSPTYFPSLKDVEYGNDFTIALQREHATRIRGYVCVNPNYQEHARAEVTRGRAAGLIGVKLAASRRADDALVDTVCEAARDHGLPILHHIWQGRRRDWPGQEASDGAELCRLAARHTDVRFILAHIGGGGDWRHTLAVVPPHQNVYLDLSGTGVDGGMLESALAAVGPERLLWGCDMTLDAGWGKLRYLEHLLPPAEYELVAWKNALRIFPRGSFPTD
jgi:uncharacterized protein